MRRARARIFFPARDARESMRESGWWTIKSVNGWWLGWCCLGVGVGVGLKIF